MAQTFWQQFDRWLMIDIALSNHYQTSLLAQQAAVQMLQLSEQQRMHGELLQQNVEIETARRRSHDVDVLAREFEHRGMSPLESQLQADWEMDVAEAMASCRVASDRYEAHMADRDRWPGSILLERGLGPYPFLGLEAEAWLGLGVVCAILGTVAGKVHLTNVIPVVLVGLAAIFLLTGVRGEWLQAQRERQFKDARARYRNGEHFGSDALVQEAAALDLNSARAVRDAYLNELDTLALLLTVRESRIVDLEVVLTAVGEERQRVAENWPGQW